VVHFGLDGQDLQHEVGDQQENHCVCHRNQHHPGHQPVRGGQRQNEQLRLSVLVRDAALHGHRHAIVGRGVGAAACGLLVLQPPGHQGHPGQHLAAALDDCSLHRDSAPAAGDPRELLALGGTLYVQQGPLHTRIQQH